MRSTTWFWRPSLRLLSILVGLIRNFVRGLLEGLLFRLLGVVFPVCLVLTLRDRCNAAPGDEDALLRRNELEPARELEMGS